MRVLLWLAEKIDRLNEAFASIVRWALLANALLITGTAFSRKLLLMAWADAFDMQWHFFAAVVLWFIKDIRSKPKFEDNLRNPMLAMMWGFSLASAMSEPGGAGTLGFNPEIAERMSRNAEFTRVQNARLPRSRKSLLRNKR